ncbi:MAG: cation:proton antiporter, partial [Cyanobacteria bacterium J06553_1]
MDANTILSLILRLTIWFLLTADFSLPNILIGLAIAVILPRGQVFPG